jgi:uncharacterized caspase-like protein
MPAGKIVIKREKINNIYGFCVGINEYENGIQKLNGCVRDAEDILAALSPKEYTLLLDNKATKKNILATVSNYCNTLKKGDLLVFSVSAHGTVINKVNKELAICTIDSERNNLLGTVLSTTFLLNALCDISDNGCKVLLILDICHSGAIGFDLSKYSGVLSGGGMSAIYACGPNETAKEKIFEEETKKPKTARTIGIDAAPKKPKKGDEKIAQGVFTKFLIDGLQKDTIKEGAKTVTLRNLYDYIYQKVCETMPDQHPALIGTLEGNTVLKVFD